MCCNREEMCVVCVDAFGVHVGQGGVFCEVHVGRAHAKTRCVDFFPCCG